MTQMLLFDAPADAAILPVAESFQAETAVVERRVPVKRSAVAKRSGVAAETDQEGGVHHMGDLARLVLLRYDVVAKRRAVMAARRVAR